MIEILDLIVASRIIILPNQCVCIYLSVDNSIHTAVANQYHRGTVESKFYQTRCMKRILHELNLRHWGETIVIISYGSPEADK